MKEITDVLNCTEIINFYSAESLSRDEEHKPQAGGKYM